MKWEFSPLWFFIGIVVAIAGILIVKFYKQIADSFGRGILAYNKTKYVGMGAIALGLILMVNLHSLILYFIFHLIMPDRFP